MSLQDLIPCEFRRTAVRLLFGAAIVILLALFTAPAALAYDDEEVEFLYLINEHRVDNHLQPLQIDQKLSWAATDYDNIISQLSESEILACGHSCGGTTIGSRIRARGYTFPGAALGENIAWASSTDPQYEFNAQQVLDAWKASPGHNANMLNSSYCAIGIDKLHVSPPPTDPSAPDRYYWTTDFGSYCENEPQPPRPPQPDTTAPNVSINIPANGSLVSGLTYLQVDANDNVGVISVDIFIDGQLVSSPMTAPYFYIWDTTGLTGSHMLEAIAYDAAGNFQSTFVNVSVEVFQPSHRYFFTWYDQSNADWRDWVLMANPATGTASARTEVKIGNYTMAGDNIAVGAPASTPQFPGVRSGPVTVASTQPLISSQRVLYKNSLEEVLSTEESRLSDHFWWTWYDQSSPGFMNWVLVANPSTMETVHAVINFTNIYDSLPVTAESDILPGENWTPTFDGKMGGPVEVKAYLAGAGHSWPTDARNVISSQRALTNYSSAFNEVPGIPDNELTDHYLWTWYDQSSTGFTDWVLVANPSATETVHAVVSFTNLRDGALVTDEQDILPGLNWTPTFPGKMGGPVEVKAYLAGAGHSWPADARDVIASQRIIAGPSFEEVPGYPYNALTGDYHWTWYDQLSSGSENWVLVANPTTDTVHAIVSFTNRADGTLVTAGSDILPGQNWTPTFPGKMGGPLDVKAYLASGSWPADERTVMVSQRVLWNGYFNEVLGTVLASGATGGVSTNPGT